MSKRNNYVVLEDQLVDLDDPSSANLGVLEARYLLSDVEKFYRVVHLVAENCLLTSNSKFCHSINF